eukprot:CAMPEP_0177796774 /NCGR_PEP_ID=MMETSP0491_2-20121128/26953_1 /TAXON_ID=63592 /ORGANISM="Tetraselmis chuii, Strain PLY429" /LENGTH=90 /DNA_ID=CAMNT_0019319709 /DNA_START=234 /DNA_END=506 /DNA_ORIENTATION=+
MYTPSRTKLACGAAAKREEHEHAVYVSDSQSYDSDDESGELRDTVESLEDTDSSAERIKKMRIWSLMHGGGAMLTTKVTRNLTAIKQIAT